MANIKFSLQSDTATGKDPSFSNDYQVLVMQAFGYESVEVYPESESTSSASVKDMKEGQGALLGHPVFMPLVLGNTIYDTLENGEVKKNGGKADKMYLPLVIIEASRTKVIELTTVEGRSGTVKEFSNMGDYEVSIKGILVGDNGAYPHIQVQNLVAFEKCPVAIEVDNDFMRYINVSKLVIKKINWKSMQGQENLQAFELDCISDDDITLIIQNAQ